MSEAGNAVKNPAAARTNAAEAGGNRVAELKVSGHLMTLDTGIFCIFHAPGGTMTDDGSGLPGVRISLPPALAGRAEGVRISTFRPDGWLDFFDGAALVRVERGPAQVLVTVYQSQTAAPETAPRLQVLRLTPDGAPAGRPVDAAAMPQARATPAGRVDVVAHVQRTGDMGGEFGAWVGTRGSGSWIEGFAINPPEGLGPQDMEYQAVLGRGWLSPWIEGGKFCGSRGMALPLLGMNVRLKGDAAKTHECSYFATFVDGSGVGPVPGGEPCQADSLAALESFQIVLRPRGMAVAARPAAGAARSAAPVPFAPRPAVAKTTAPKPAAAKSRGTEKSRVTGKSRAAAKSPAGRQKAAAKTAPAKRGATRAPQRPASQRPGPQRPGPQRPGPQRPGPQRPGPQRPGPQRPGPGRTR
jgi:hypothetical protein